MILSGVMHSKGGKPGMACQYLGKGMQGTVRPLLFILHRRIYDIVTTDSVYHDSACGACMSCLTKFNSTTSYAGRPVRALVETCLQINHKL